MKVIFLLKWGHLLGIQFLLALEDVEEGPEIDKRSIFQP